MYLILYSYITSFFFYFFFFFFFFFNDTAPPEIYTLSLHDALPTSPTCARWGGSSRLSARGSPASPAGSACRSRARSEEHTSELQSPYDLVCRLLLEKKKKKKKKTIKKKKKKNNK